MLKLGRNGRQVDNLSSFAEEKGHEKTVRQTSSTCTDSSVEDKSS